jgi:hypothetical protein
MKKLLFIIILTTLLSSCTKKDNYAAEVIDLNGTWLPASDYRELFNLPEEERTRLLSNRMFSWGETVSKKYTSFDIDISADEPFFIEPGLGHFPIIEITKTGINSIKIRAYRGFEDSPDDSWEPELTFHFIDKDTLWIETEDFKGSEDYGRDVLWHRLSGPAQ